MTRAKTSERHIAADTNGLPYAVYVTAADVTGRNGAVEMIKINRASLSEAGKFPCDGGYLGEKLRRQRNGN